MIYADILNTLKPHYLQELEYVGENLSGETVLLFAFLMEIPIVMILLSRILNRKANRIANFIAAPISILWVIIPSIVMSDSNTPLSYIFSQLSKPLPWHLYCGMRGNGKQINYESIYLLHLW
jgi:hypothetical protein